MGDDMMLQQPNHSQLVRHGVIHPFFIEWMQSAILLDQANIYGHGENHHQIGEYGWANRRREEIKQVKPDVTHAMAYEQMWMPELKRNAAVVKETADPSWSYRRGMDP